MTFPPESYARTYGKRIISDTDGERLMTRGRLCPVPELDDYDKAIVAGTVLVVCFGCPAVLLLGAWAIGTAAEWIRSLT